MYMMYIYITTIITEEVKGQFHKPLTNIYLNFSVYQIK